MAISITSKLASCFTIKENDIRPRLCEPLFLFVFALAVRLSLFPYWQNLGLSGDEIFYWDWARRVAAINLLKDFTHPPLWTYVLSFSAFISKNCVYGRILTVIISSFSVPVIYLLGKLVFNRKVGIIAGVTYSIYPNVVGFSHYLWSETLLALLILLSTYFLFKGLHDENKYIFLCLSFIVTSIGLLVKEFAIIHFGSTILTLIAIKGINRKWIIIWALVIFLIPVLIYSTLVSISARRPVILADSFIYNANEVNDGKEVWKKSLGENIHIFRNRLFMFRKMPARFIRQVHNLWTPNSFPIFRLLHAGEKYNTIPCASLIVYIVAGMYILVTALGLIGMCCATQKAFQVFSIANLILLSSTGLLFLLCSRFRIPFMSIFIIHSSVVLSNPKELLIKLTWRKVLFLVIVFAIFIEIIISKWTTLGFWG